MVAQRLEAGAIVPVPVWEGGVATAAYVWVVVGVEGVVGGGNGVSAGGAVRWSVLTRTAGGGELIAAGLRSREGLLLCGCLPRPRDLFVFFFCLERRADLWCLPCGRVATLGCPRSRL